MGHGGWKRCVHVRSERAGPVVAMTRRQVPGELVGAYEAAVRELDKVAFDLGEASLLVRLAGADFVLRSERVVDQLNDLYGHVLRMRDDLREVKTNG